MYGQQPYYPTPAMQTAQQRLQMMEAQYPQFASPQSMGYAQPNPYQPATAQAPSAAPILKGRPVSNEEEANAAMIDFDGSLFVFPDKAHGKIYTKQLGLDGNIIFNKYNIESPIQPVQEKVEAPQQDLSEYVKKGDLDTRLQGLVEKMALLEKRLNTPTYSQNKGGNKS